MVEGTSGLTSAHLERIKRQNMALVPTLKSLGDGDDRQAIRNEVRDYARLVARFSSGIEETTRRHRTGAPLIIETARAALGAVFCCAFTCQQTKFRTRGLPRFVLDIF